MKIQKSNIIGYIITSVVFFLLTMYIGGRNMQENIISTLIFITFYITFDSLWRFIKAKKQKNDTQSTATIDDAFIDQLVDALGGIENITQATSEVSRVKITLKSATEIDTPKIEALNLSGIFVTGENVQITLGEKSNAIANIIHEML